MVDALLAFSQASGIHAFMHNRVGMANYRVFTLRGSLAVDWNGGPVRFAHDGSRMRYPHERVTQARALWRRWLWLERRDRLDVCHKRPGSIFVHNPAFQTKLTLMGIAGLNILFFYRFAFLPVKATNPDANAPHAARLVAAISLSCWIGVIICGRLITYFRPPYHWCFWC